MLNIEDGMKEQFIGRADGPNYRWRNACGAVASEHQYSSVTSRAWREIATCCAVLRRCNPAPTLEEPCPPTMSADGEAAIRRLRHLAGHRGPFDDPTGDQCNSICGHAPNAVAAAAVTECQNSHGLAIIQRAAVDNAERVEDGLARARMREWKRWLQGEQSRGLGRQHRFTRVAYGWAPDRSGSGSQRCDAERPGALEGNGSCDAGVANGRIRIQRGDDGAPMGSQATAEQQADHWAAIWAEGKELPQPAWPSDMGPPLRRPTVEELRSAARTFPWGTGLAWDQLHPRLLDCLSDTRLDELITLLVRAEDTGEWPKAVGVVNTVLLPKPDGSGFRPIGLFPMVVRLWMRTRRNHATDWEASNSRRYFYAGPARGAHVAAWQHAARAEASAFAKASFFAAAIGP